MCGTTAPFQKFRTPRGINADIQLLVEGRDQEGFCEGLIQHLALQGVQLQDFGGVGELQKFLSLLVKTPDFSRVTSVGIVRDAEASETGAFESVQQGLARAGLPVPDQTGQRVGGPPAVTVMILPGDNRTGMLETLLCETFGDEGVRTCIDEFFQCVETLQGAVNRREKARSRAYLATKPDPHLSIGVAAKRGYWNLDHPVLHPLRTFLQDITVAP